MLQTCSAAGFNTDFPLYVASGLLSYTAGEQMWSKVTASLVPYASRLIHKEMYLNNMELAGLHPEQLALVDFMVLVQARKFVGLGGSTFSTFVQEYRHVLKISNRNSTWMVPGEVLGNQEVLSKCATLV